MSKIKFELDLSDVFAYSDECDEYGNPNGVNFDSWIEGEITQQIKSSLSGKIESAISNKINDVMSERLCDIEEQINQRLNVFMDEFFTTPYDIKDRYGDVIQKDVCVKTLLKNACDDFVNQRVDSNGNVVKSTYYNDKSMTRVDYMVKKSWDSQLKSTIEKLTTEYTSEINKKIKEEISKQLGSKLTAIVGIDNILK